VPPSLTKKPKRSTERGEADAKLIAALTQHHQYGEGGCLNLEPIGCNKLAGEAQVGRGSASRFFKKQFGGHTKYRTFYCGDAVRLVAAIKQLNDEYTPDSLFGRTLPAERERGDDQ